MIDISYDSEYKVNDVIYYAKLEMNKNEKQTLWLYGLGIFIIPLNKVIFLMVANEKSEKYQSR